MAFDRYGLLEMIALRSLSSLFPASIAVVVAVGGMVGVVTRASPALSYASLPLWQEETVALAPLLDGSAVEAPGTFSVLSGALPPGLVLDPATGVIGGVPTAPGTFWFEVQFEGPESVAVTEHRHLIVAPPAAGLSADRPVLYHGPGGVLGYPWGAAGSQWPVQLFWQNSDLSQLNAMRADAAGIEASGKAPVLNCVAWGYEYASATGAGIPDNSGLGGWREWGQWMSDPARAPLKSTNWNGVPEDGYITPLMPMDPEDWPSEWTLPAGWQPPPGWIDGKPAARTSYAEWLGVRLAQLAWFVDCRGMFCADYVVGLEWGDGIDYNPRVVDDFADWADVSIPPGTVTERANYLQANFRSLWWDYKGTRFRDFYAAMGRSLLANGKIPMVGGQILPKPMLVRGWGNDFRLCTQGPEGLPGRYWFFNIEVQADSLRPPQAYWESSLGFGATSAREPDMRFGAHLDASGGQGEFDRSAANAGKDSTWAARHLTQQWLSVGWTHIAGRDGAVRRACLSLMRSYWDAGQTPETEYRLIVGHIPRHPFGPAFYYSAAIERSFETAGGIGSNNMWWCLPRFLRELSPTSVTRGGRARGLTTGYFVSDVALAAMRPEDYPSAWIVYDAERLPADERARLEAMAPVYDIDAGGADGDGSQAAALLARGPLRIEQGEAACLNSLAFIDQNGSVIVMVSNTQEAEGMGTLVFTDVNDGVHPCFGLLGAEDTTLTVVEHTGTVPVTLPPRGTLVFEIPGLQWIGHGGATYEDWAARQYPSGGGSDPDRLPEADPAGTGLTNLMRYAFHLPGAGADAPLVELRTRDAVGDPRWSLVFSRNPAARDLRYTAEASADLLLWEPVGSASPGIPVECEIVLPETLAARPQGFLRVRAELVPASD